MFRHRIYCREKVLRAKERVLRDAMIYRKKQRSWKQSVGLQTLRREGGNGQCDWMLVSKQNKKPRNEFGA